MKHLRDLSKARSIYGVALARRAKNVNMPESERQEPAHFVSENILEQTVVLIPGNFAAHENAPGVPAQNLTSIAASAFSRCEIVRAPHSTELTSGCARTHAIASRTPEIPVSCSIARRRAKAPKLFSLK